MLDFELLRAFVAVADCGGFHRAAERLNAGRLDVVFAKRPLGPSKGRLVWREPLVWAAADTFDLIPGAALPLALYRERSVSREAALAALQDGELHTRLASFKSGLAAVRDFDPANALGQIQSWGHVDSMSGLPESGLGWASSF